mgnify:CR=1 FL=1
METFRFAVMGAGNIGRKFCEAARMAGYETAAVASRSVERAKKWAAENNIRGGIRRL